MDPHDRGSALPLEPQAPSLSLVDRENSAFNAIVVGPTATTFLESNRLVSSIGRA